MVIDARQRFARRTALWIIKAGLPKEEVVARLTHLNKTNVFPQWHIQAIAQHAKELRGRA